MGVCVGVWVCGDVCVWVGANVSVHDIFSRERKKKRKLGDERP